MNFGEQLAAVQARHASMLCVGLDPEPARFPPPVAVKLMLPLVAPLQVTL